MPKRKFSSSALTVAKRRRANPTRFVRKTSWLRGMRVDRKINMHRFARWVATPQDFSLSAASAGNACVFQLNDLGSVSEFTTLYDRFKITKVQCRFHLITNPDAFLYTNAAVNTQNHTNWFPKLWYVRDYDDSIVEGLAAIKERAIAKCIVMNPNRMYTVNLRPATLVQAYATSTTTGSVPQWNKWIDMGAPDVKYYGLKYALDAEGITPTANFPFKLRVEFKYWFTCKDVR